MEGKNTFWRRTSKKEGHALCIFFEWKIDRFYIEITNRLRINYVYLAFISELCYSSLWHPISSHRRHASPRLFLSAGLQLVSLPPPTRNARHVSTTLQSPKINAQYQSNEAMQYIPLVLTHKH